MAVNREKVLEVLRRIKDPGLNRDIVSLDLIRDLEVDGTTIIVETRTKHSYFSFQVKIAPACK
jgi:metal-sulfur cluster biosynthetic enzyme